MKTSTRLFILFSLLVSSLCITPNAWAEENTNYFRLINRSASAQTCDNRKNETPLTLQYKISSNGEWKTFTFQSTYPSVPAGDTIYFRQLPSNASKHYVNTASNYGRFLLTSGDWEVAGDIMTLIYANPGESEITNSHALFYLFYGCTALKDASKLILPATTLSASCYAQMFDGCSNLQNGPKELPATTIGVSAYFKMFNNCYKLQKAPTIKATVIGNTSMQNMFYNCSTMTTPPDTLYAREIGTQSYNSMFWACKSLTSLPVIMATSFPQQSSSASTPGSAFSTMFRNCSTALTNVSLDVRFNSWDWKTESYNQTINWLNSVPNVATNTFICSQTLFQNLPSSSTGKRRDAYTIPSNWTVIFFPVITFNVSTAGATWDGKDNANRTVDWYGDSGDEFPVPVKEEEVFNGWFTQPTGGTKVLSADWKAPANRANPVVTTTLYAQFGSACNFTFIPNGGTWTGGGMDTIELPKPVSESDIAITRTGYAWNGWNPPLDIVNQPDTATTFTAQWLPLFTFNPNGGKWEDESTDSKVITTAVGETPTRNGYAFTEWDNNYDADNLPSEPTTFTAGWNAFTYTFDVATNGGTWDGGITTTLSFSTPDLTSLTTPKKQGYAFSGWNTVADGSGVYYDKDNLPSANTTFYAQYVRAFTMTAEGATTIGISKNGTPGWTPDLYYSIDGGATWTQWVVGTTTVALAQGEQVSFYGTNKSGFNQSIGVYQDGSSNVGGIFYYFTNSNNKVSLSGNIMTIVDGFSPTNTVPDYCFAGLFKAMKIKDANQLQLPTGMAPYAYAYMFSTSSIETAPALPATTVDAHAYESMFNRCTSLTAIGNIPATTIGNYAMRNMFYKCTHLTTAGNISATEVGEGTCYSMFYGCTMLETAPDTLYAKKLYNTSYYSMFFGCAKLKKAPVILATDIPAPTTASNDNDAMEVMFRQCSLLNEMNVRFKSWADYSSSYMATYLWLEQTTNVSTSVFICPSALNTSSRSTNHIPANWTVKYIPELWFNVHGGHWIDGTTNDLHIEYMEKAFDAETNPIPTSEPSVESMHCVGWNTQEDASGDWLTYASQPQLYHTEKQQITYYAQYGYFYTFNVAQNSGSWSAEETINNDSVTNTYLIAANGLPVTYRTDYTLQGWNTQADGSGSFLTADALPQADTYYYAIFLPSITFKPNGGTWGTDTGMMDSIFTSFTENPVVTRNGYSFVKWNTAADGSGTDFDWQNPPSSPTTYYAVWDEIVYTFSLSNYPDASWDGSDKTDSVISTTDLLAFGRPVPQLGTQYFAGWSTSATGTTNELNLANLPTEATTYYPIFRNYLCITALHDNVQIGTYYVKNFVSFDLYYSTDGMEWTKVITTSRFSFVTLANKGDKVYLKGNNPKGINSKENSVDFQSSHYIKFTISDSAAVSGNIMTLINSEEPPLTIPNAYSFARLFTETRLVHASELQLPATELKNGCYESMFQDCEKLIDAPQFGEFTTISYAAFKSMFYGCSSLTVAPEFTSVTEVERIGCQTMFYGCTSLVDAPTLTATTLAKDCYYCMFYNCSALRSMHVAFTSWGTDNTEYTSNWMYGTTTDINDHAEFTCAGLPILRGTSNIQVNWKVVIPDIVVDNDAYSSEITNGADITLTNGATLTLNNDFNAVKITVAAGSKLTVPEAYTLTSDTIILQGGDTTNGTYRYLTPEMVVNGHIKKYNDNITPILYDYLLNDDQYYTLALPYDVNTSDITYPDGTPAKIGIQYYDGEKRALSGKNSGAWTTIYDSDTQTPTENIILKAGRGYTVYTVAETGKTYSRVRFPMAPDFTAQGEQTKSVNVFGYGCTDGKPKKGNENNSGWNLIGNPYLATCGNSWGTLVLNGNIIDYVIIPANDGQSYHTEVIIDAALPAFKNFFVQVFEDGTLSYNLSSRAQQAPMRSENANTRILAGITLSGNGQEDKMGLTLRDDYTDDYDPYADLSKWMNNSLNLYAVVGEHNLTMAAVNMERAGLAIPLVVKTTKAGTLTFDLNEAWNMNIESLDHLYLEDRTKGVVTDLLTDSYSYEAAKGETKGRFFLYAESAHNTPTDVETTTMGKTIEVIKYIENGRLIILRNGIRFDSTGKCLD